MTLSEILILKDDPVLSRRDLGGPWWTAIWEGPWWTEIWEGLGGLKEKKKTLPYLKALVNSTSFKWPRHANHQLERQDMVLNDEILHLIFR